MDTENQPVLRTAELVTRVRAFIDKAANEAAFNDLALSVFAFQFEEVLIYRRLCKSRGAGPDSVKHWKQIPALPTAAFKEAAVTSLAEGERTHEFQSSGTTDQTPSRHYHNAASLSLYEASLLPWFEQNFPDNDAMFVFLTPPSTQAQHSSLVHMFKTIRQKFAGPDSQFCGRMETDGAWALDFDSLSLAVRDAMSANRPMAILGTAFSFIHWVDRLASNKIRLRLPTGSRILETGGYKGRSRVVPKIELRRLMTKYLGVPESRIITEYGMCELSSQAYSADGGAFRFPPWARTQIVSPETGAVVSEGETGLLRIFDLANIFSVMAIQTEDLAVAREDGFESAGPD